MAIIPKYIEVKTAAGQRAAFLSPKADGLKDCSPDVRLNGESTLEFMLPANSEKLAELIPECRIIANNREYTILKDEANDFEMTKDNKLWAKVMAVESWYLLDMDYAEPYITNDPGIPTPADLSVIIVSGGSDLSGGLYTVGSAAHALYALLQGTGWSIGTVDVSGVHDLETQKESVLSNIKKVQEIWGGYLVWDSINKTVSLRDANVWQPYTGFQIKYAKNLQHITRTQSNRLVTKLYPFGADDLDIASVNGGEKFITNNTFSPNTYIDKIQYPDIYDAQELMDKATIDLSLICRSRNLYSVKIADLRTLPEYAHEDFSLGDMADILNSRLGIDDNARIIRYKFDLFQPWKCELEMGDPQERLVESLKASFNTSNFVGSVFNSSGKMSGYHIEDLSVTADKIDNLAITAGKIASLAITTDKIDNLAITGGKIASLAVTGGKIDNLAITAAKIANLTITGGKIANATIDNAKIVDLEVEKLTGTYITGKIIRTAVSGERIELGGDSLKTYNDSGQLNGMVTNNATGDNYGDVYFYDSGVKVMEIYNILTGNGFSIRPAGSAALFLGVNGKPTYPEGNWNFINATVTNLYAKFK